MTQTYYTTTLQTNVASQTSSSVTKISEVFATFTLRASLSSTNAIRTLKSLVALLERWSANRETWNLSFYNKQVFLVKT